MTEKAKTIREILNEIKWDKKNNVEDFSLKYIHRGSPKNYKDLKITDIKDILGAFFTIKGLKFENELVNIPFHRILEIKDNKTNEILYLKAQKG